MEQKVWSNSSEKLAHILVLRGSEVSLLKITGSALTLKGRLRSAREAIEQGKAPTEAGAKSVETMDAQTITKAQVSPGNGSLTLEGGPEGAKSLKFSASDNKADQILNDILDQAGRPFHSSKEEISALEALMPPAITGGIVGLLWYGVYDSAVQMAAGKVVEAQGFRHRGFKKMMISLAEMLGTNGTLALGAVIGALVIGWAAMRIIKRPERTVWVPEAAAS